MPLAAVLIVDIQNDFCPGGSLAVPNGNEVIEPCNELSSRGEQLGYMRIFSADRHPYFSTHFKKNGGQWPEHCVLGTVGAKFHRNLEITDGSFLVFKGIGQCDNGYSPFDKNVEIYIVLFGKAVRLQFQNLNIMLAYFNIDHMAIAGLATDYCVKSAALDAKKLGYQVYLASDACRAVNLNPNDGDKAIEEMRQAGIVISPAEEVLKSTLSFKERQIENSNL